MTRGDDDEERPSRFALWVSVAFAVVARLGAYVLIGEVRPMFGPTYRELSRMPSPGGRADAVVVAWDGGATTLVGHDVHVLARGGTASPSNQVIALYGARLPETRLSGDPALRYRWEGPRRLVVECEFARRAEILRRTVRVGDDVVEIVLVVHEH